MTVKPGRGDELLPWITRLKAQVAEEKGQTLEYTWARDAPNGDVFVVWERYASVDAWKTCVILLFSSNISLFVPRTIGYTFHTM